MKRKKRRKEKRQKANGVFFREKRQNSRTEGKSELSRDLRAFAVRTAWRGSQSDQSAEGRDSAACEEAFVSRLSVRHKEHNSKISPNQKLQGIQINNSKINCQRQKGTTHLAFTPPPTNYTPGLTGNTPQVLSRMLLELIAPRLRLITAACTRPLEITHA